MVYLPPVAALDAVALIGLTDDGDVGLTVTSSLVDVTSGGDGNESGNDELFENLMVNLLKYSFKMGS